MASKDKYMARPKFRLAKVKLPGSEGDENVKYRAIVVGRETYETSYVIDEMLDYSSLRISPHIVQSVVSSLFESMIANTLSDGVTRCFGDYFAVRLDIGGTFDSSDAQFDPRKNTVKLSLIPLKRFRRSFQTRRPQNKIKAPRALMKAVHGEQSPIDMVKLGENIVIEGRALTLLDETDFITVSVYDKNLTLHSATFCPTTVIEQSSSRIIIPFPKEFLSIDFHSQASYRLLYFELSSRGGNADGKRHMTKYKHGVSWD